MALIISPTALVVIDNSIDISMVYSITEEKEEKGSQKNVEIKSLLDDKRGKEITFTLNVVQDNMNYFLKKYSKPHLTFISPPPDSFNS